MNRFDPEPKQVTIEIDSSSGFCFGVVTAITKAEEELANGETLYCIGDIVHNTGEVERLKSKGLHTITHQDLSRLHNAKVLLRAHGEPPETYAMANRNSVKVIDATCPVVLKLQQRIKKAYNEGKTQFPGLQIVIYGQKGHAEVNGLVGQTEGTAIVIENTEGLDKLNFNAPIALYSQTTKSLEGYKEIITEITHRLSPNVHFEYADTICRQVSNRVEHLRQFAGRHDVVLFVAGEKSSNGKILYNRCREVNPRTYMVPGKDNVKAEWLTEASSIGICGATSTPRWLMEDVAKTAEDLSEQSAYQ